MSTLLPRPSASAGSGESFVASSSKMSASHQRQVQRARLLAVVDLSRSPINKSSNYDPTAPVTPSAGMMSLITGLSFIPKLPLMVEQVLGAPPPPWGGLCVDIGEKEIIVIAVSDNNAVDSLTHSTEITENLMVQTLGDVVCPASMLDTNA